MIYIKQFNNMINIIQHMTNKKFYAKAIKGLMTVCLIGFVASPVSAQSFRNRRGSFEGGDDYHFGYLSGSVGYSMLQTSLTGAMPQGNVGGSIGFGYEFRNSGFWANVGGQISFHRSKLMIDQYDTRDEANQDPYQGYDTQFEPTTFHYRVNQVDEMQWNYLDVPVLVGYYVRGFHIGAGVKVSYALHPMTRTTGTYNLSATNRVYDITFEDMPDRGYTDYEFRQLVENQLKVGASLIGEIGYDLLSSVPTSSRICHVLKIAFYFEYGLNSQLRGWDIPQKRLELITYDKRGLIDARMATINPYVNTFTKPSHTVPFFTGVKLTYMIGGSRTARVGFHHGCMCYN